MELLHSLTCCQRRKTTRTSLERPVSDYMRSFTLLVLDTPDEPGRESCEATSSATSSQR